MAHILVKKHLIYFKSKKILLFIGKGWYRDCGITSFANDFDFAIKREDYQLDFEKNFLGNKKVWLTLTLGQVTKLVELRF